MEVHQPNVFLLNSCTFWKLKTVTSDADDTCYVENTAARFKHTGRYLDLKSQAVRSASTWGAA
jgi:hypothetical protein